MTFMLLIKHFFLSFISAFGFAVMFKVRKESLLLCGLIGAVGWCTYKSISLLGSSELFANFFATIIVSALSEIFARLKKLPVTCFVLPGIVLLVPGYGIYLTIQYLIQDKYSLGIAKGVETLFISGAIAVGIIFVSAIGKAFKHPPFKKSNSN